MATLTRALALEPLHIDERVAESWSTLRVLLRGCGRRMPVNDSWIAATAMSLRVPVVTQNEDYAHVAGLDVIAV